MNLRILHDRRILAIRQSNVQKVFAARLMS